MPTCPRETRAPSKTYRFERGPFVDIIDVAPSYVSMIEGVSERERRDLLYMAAWGKSWWVNHTIETKGTSHVR